MLSLQGIGKRNRDTYILRDISFTQLPFQHIAIAGETGSGKSTLLKIIAGLVQPDEGAATLQGEKIKGPDDQLVPGHKGVAYLSQHFELRNNYWVHEVLAYANRLTDTEAERIYSICQIDHLLGRRTHQLSGGEKQRIATARLLISDPVLLLLDEPFSNLDMIHRGIMKKVINDIAEHLKITMILVSHEPADILPWADQLLLIKDGMLKQQGTPEEVYNDPEDLYCAGLLGDYCTIPATLATLLTGEFNAAWKDSALILRPEHITVSAGKEGVDARIQKLSFKGSHYEVIAVVGDLPLMFYQQEKKYREGEAVKLCASASQLVVLPG
jgi:ABC-type sugar transport system ATPase subunit